MKEIAVDRRASLAKQPDWFGASALTNGRWAVAVKDGLNVLDRDLAITEHHSFPKRLPDTWSGNLARICPFTHRVAMVSWPQVDVRGIAGPVQEFDVPSGDSSFASGVHFEDDSILFVAPPVNNPGDPYRLVRGILDSGDVETIAELTCYGVFEIFVRPSFPGIVVVAQDGPDFICLDWVEPNDEGFEVTSIRDGFHDLSPSGNRFVKSGVSLDFGRWPSLERTGLVDADRLKSLLPANGEWPYVFSRFLDEDRVCAWNVYAPELGVFDAATGEVIDTWSVPLDSIVSVTHRNGETLLVGESELIVTMDI